VAQSSRYTAFTGTLDITGLPATTADPTIVDSGNGTGTLTFDAGTGLAFTRSTRVAPFNADIALSLTIIDGDSIVYASNPARFGTATSGNGIAFSGAKEMRFGRLWLGNAIGSELIDLPIPLSVQYWNGFAFVTNSSDSCTTLPATAPNTPLALSNFQGALSACETAVSPTTTLTFASGQGSLKLTKPGRGNTGSVDMTMNLGTASGTTCITAGGSTVAAGTAGRTWLQGNWGGSATYTVNPTARATFGPYHSSQEFIYQRENY
jgi:MSHA biogenesis protein MshQ